VQPPGVVKLDGEFYLTETRPGQGIRSLGVDERPAAVPPPPAPRIDSGVQWRGDAPVTAALAEPRR
jgi:hypothetical protein